ncbi:YXWGXW repeat-containing protein [Microvirga lotononidis]|uniref:YXWGXW repeat-containing protein n=1 Tax=Microvirga lotononidis TaxID=864069 RepID=UPI000A068A6C|nr:YXWGXW repeat-containing protein [Microvirga lotononidis]WQO27295.1 YXWGXW repeat-containing protein [Microvirga lotononidis]
MLTRRSILSLFVGATVAAAVGTAASTAVDAQSWTEPRPPRPGRPGGPPPRRRPPPPHPRFERRPRPRPGFVWVPGRWVWSSRRGRWVWVDGHWRRRRFR